MKKLAAFLVTLALGFASLPAMAEEAYIELPKTGYAVRVPEGYTFATPDYIPEDSPILSYYDMTPREYRKQLREYDTALEAFSAGMHHEMTLTWFEAAGSLDFDQLPEDELRYYYEDELAYYSEDSECRVVELGPVDTGNVTVIKKIIDYGDGYISADYDAAVGDIWFMLFSYCSTEGYPEEYDAACMELLSSLTPVEEVAGSLIETPEGGFFGKGEATARPAPGGFSDSSASLGINPSFSVTLVAVLLLVLGTILMVIAAGLAANRKRRAEELRSSDAAPAMQDISPAPAEFASLQQEIDSIEAEAAKAAFCQNCGNPLPEGANFCPECGTRAG